MTIIIQFQTTKQNSIINSDLVIFRTEDSIYPFLSSNPIYISPNVIYPNKIELEMEMYFVILNILLLK